MAVGHKGLSDARKSRERKDFLLDEAAPVVPEHTGYNIHRL